MVCNEYMSKLHDEYRRWIYDNYESRGVVTDITFDDWMEMKDK